MCMDKSVSAFPDGENLFKWIATITGPKDTVSSLQMTFTYITTINILHYKVACNLIIILKTIQILGFWVLLNYRSVYPN